MASQWGKYLEISIFGESHGKGTGLVLGRLPAGLKCDEDFIRKEMARRAPGNSVLSTPRKESDTFEIISGVHEGVCTGAPLCVFIANNNTKSGDYSDLKHIMRPGHSDWPAHVKYKGFNDIRGGGHFSARLTAPLVFAGALAKCALKEKGISIGAHISSIKTIYDKKWDKPSASLLQQLNDSDFPLLDPSLRDEMEQCILDAKASGDSVGGSIEVGLCGVPAGLGEPFFYSLESSIASLVFSVPGVKGLEFGLGFTLSEMHGSEANDSYIWDENHLSTESLKQGGILGGISVGKALSFRVAMKPTASIAKVQQTVDLKNKTQTILELKGRHDPCIVPRAVPILEAVAALSLWDMILGEHHGYQ